MSDDSFESLLRDLTGYDKLLPRKARQAVQQTAIRTKKGWQADARRGAGGRRYAPTIDYELRTPSGFGVTDIQGEVGPDLARYGGRTGRGGLIPSLGILDDPESTPQGVSPSRARRRAERLAAEELNKGAEIAINQSLDAFNL